MPKTNPTKLNPSRPVSNKSFYASLAILADIIAGLLSLDPNAGIPLTLLALVVSCAGLGVGIYARHTSLGKLAIALAALSLISSLWDIVVLLLFLTTPGTNILG